jgi:hypothetical protein
MLRRIEMSSRYCIESQKKRFYRTKQKLILALAAVVFLVAAVQPFAFGSDGSSNTAPAGKTSADAASAKNKGASALDYLPMDDIQDVAYTLQRIRQLAVNIYIESTRKKVHHYELSVTSFSVMPTTALEEQNAYLPLRKGWLAFFIATMEPLVQILNENLKDLDSRATQYAIPLQYRQQWQDHVVEWKKSVHKLDEQLNVCADMLDDPSPGNVQVAKAARAIDAQITVLDDILHQASKFLSEKVPEP